MNLLEKLYGAEDKSNRAVWDETPFKYFSPNCAFLCENHLVRAISLEDAKFFITYLRNNYLPDLSDKDTLETQRNAMNFGISALNELCGTHIPEEFQYLRISPINPPFNPTEFFKEAMNKLKNSLQGTKKPQDLLDAYNAARAWGLGELVMAIEESLETHEARNYSKAIDVWFYQQLEFSSPKNSLNDDFLWETKTGINVVGTNKKPYFSRIKARDEKGNIRYGSLIMKMFSKRGFLDKIRDHSAVELVVQTPEEVERLVAYFKEEIIGCEALSGHKTINSLSPRYSSEKFSVAVPVKIIDSPEKYIRVPVEVQIRAKQDTNHPEYKRQQFMKFFPLMYPRQVYEPILININ